MDAAGWGYCGDPWEDPRGDPWEPAADPGTVEAFAAKAAARLPTFSDGAEDGDAAGVGVAGWETVGGETAGWETVWRETVGWELPGWETVGWETLGREV